MGVNFTASSTQVTISGSVSTSKFYPAAASDQTIKSFSSAKAGTAVVAGTGVLLYTTTGGKTFYLTTFCITGSGGSGFELRNGTTIAGAVKVGGTIQGTTNNSYVFRTPVSFDTGVFLDVQGNTTCNWTGTGYEA